MNAESTFCLALAVIPLVNNLNKLCYLLVYWQMKGKGMSQKNGVRKYPSPVAFLWKAKQSV